MEVRLDPWVIGMKQFAHRADGNDLAVCQCRNAITDRVQAGKIVGHHEDGQPERLLQCPDQVVEVARRDGIQSGCRLVEKHDSWVKRECARKRDALRHSAREFGRKFVAVLDRQAHHFELGGRNLAASAPRRGRGFREAETECFAGR